MQINEHRFSYDWTLKNAKFTKDKGKVFSCFSCGGGSTMGYKMAGFDVIGCNEIDPKMFKVYKENHNPKFSFLDSITTFKERDDLPIELYDLDILDGSPPCSSFSMAGNREKDWGKEKKFSEGQKKQVLDTLFFDFIELAKKLQPKVVIAENVKGLFLGEAIKYVEKIYKEFDDAGYYCQHFFLNACTMGVPQQRERVFFICLRKDLAIPFLYSKDLFSELPYLNLDFNEKIIPLKNFVKSIKKKETQNYSINRFGDVLLDIDKPSPTITTKGRYWLNHFELIDDESKIKIGSFPLDYCFLNLDAQYVIGMSVPPVMMAQISLEIYNQWLKKINEGF